MVLIITFLIKKKKNYEGEKREERWSVTGDGVPVDGD
jgi:hypothetical protein